MQLIIIFFFYGDGFRAEQAVSFHSLSSMLELLIEGFDSFSVYLFSHW